MEEDDGTVAVEAKVLHGASLPDAGFYIYTPCYMWMAVEVEDIMKSTGDGDRLLFFFGSSCL
uniref:Uncharacterized protein n=1 Tax=Oryza sativa subsp. japonica TaxID=39947 RepID=Q5Z5R6_ORYSJ|nr:hypothetical protein [Oryza sativa Japonica Group]